MCEVTRVVFGYLNSTAADWSTLVINSQLAKVPSLVTRSRSLSLLGSLCKLEKHAMSQVATELRIEDTTDVLDVELS